MSIERRQSRYRRLRRNVYTSARLLTDGLQIGGFRYFLAMLTLTYRPGADWQPYHITELHKKIRAWLKYRGHRYSYVWVCETQERGAEHYHVLIWVPYGIRLPRADSFGWWPHGMTNIQKVEKPIGYLLKYVSKFDGRDFSAGLRTHGSGGLSGAARCERRWWLSPRYVKRKWPEHAADVRPAPGGGWLSRMTGERIPSPWAVVSIGNGTVVVRWVAGPRIGEYYGGDSHA